MSDSPATPESTSDAAQNGATSSDLPEAPVVEGATSAAEPTSPATDSMADTAGTGTIIALGCITGTVFIIILGVVYLVVTQLFG